MHRFTQQLGLGFAYETWKLDLQRNALNAFLVFVFLMIKIFKLYFINFANFIKIQLNGFDMKEFISNVENFWSSSSSNLY